MIIKHPQLLKRLRPFIQEVQPELEQVIPDWGYMTDKEIVITSKDILDRISRGMGVDMCNAVLFKEDVE